MLEAGEALRARIEEREAVLGVVGLGYMGLPRAVELGRSGYRVLGFDVSERVVKEMDAERSHIQGVSSNVVSAQVGERLLSGTTDLSRLSQCDAISLCVQTLAKTRTAPTW